MAPAVLLLLAVLLGPGDAQVTVPEITDPAWIKKMIDEHNKFRGGVTPAASNMKYMTWDPALAITALAWAEKCIFEHNIHLKEDAACHPTYTPVGENLWIGTANMEITPVSDWSSEVADYNYGANTCSKMCGHYTQVVWADTHKVGCAAYFCTKAEGFAPSNVNIVVCDYGPAGNFPTQPYATGDACGKCPAGDQCVEKLCKNAARDEVISAGNWKPAWAGAASVQSNVYSVLSCLIFIDLYFGGIPIDYI